LRGRGEREREEGREKGEGGRMDKDGESLNDSMERGGKEGLINES
jgi:hypothetical protein